MTGKGSFEDGYRDGWMGVAGDALLPPDPTHPPPGDRRDYQAGFEYGRADALERFKPGTGQS
ncbi:MAG: hypothetical protein QOC65_1089 [Sphingomonadales bacterium]|nr:hypothetical protein [Sphingomonadales bacterium]